MGYFMKKTMGIFGSRLVAFGDSITLGIGVPDDGEKWTQIIKGRFDLKLINAGVGGNTSHQGLLRIGDDVLAYEPDFVTICFGMNDHCLISRDNPRVSKESFKDNIIKMIGRIKSMDALPLLITPNYIIEGDEKSYYYRRHDPSFYDNVGGAQAWLDEYANVIRLISREENVGLVDIREECEKYDPYEFLRSLKNDLFDDGVHPHTLGATVYAKFIGDYLENNF